jgi:phosphoribosylanthranilate isomerase
MSRVRVKICGIRSLEEASTAVRLGADALGFNFWPPSPRYITPQAARDIIRQLHPFITCVGVFVNENLETIMDIVSKVGLNTVQLHGDESPEFCDSLGVMRVIKAIRVSTGFRISSIKDYRVSAVLLDAKVAGNYGGTGQRFDWNLAIQAKRFAPIILAGGISAENVADAILTVRPMAVDVCSGVEAEPGRKDLNRMKQLMEAVERANARILDSRGSLMNLRSLRRFTDQKGG